MRKQVSKDSDNMGKLWGLWGLWRLWRLGEDTSCKLVLAVW